MKEERFHYKNMKQKPKICICGDSFVDRYCYGKINRLSPEAPIPILDVEKWEDRGGGAINVANNLHALDIDFTLYTITSLKLPYKVVTPLGVVSLIKTRFVCDNYQLLRVDEPVKYRKEDLEKMEHPSFKDYDIIAFIDYDKGIIEGGKATIIDTKKKDLSIFKGSSILKANLKEYNNCLNKEIFPQIFVTKDRQGIDYYKDGEFQFNSLANAREVIDICGAGDTVMATLIFCLVTGITKEKDMAELANKAAGIVVSKFGTSVVTLNELFS